MVGPFNADFYQINGMVLESRKRREHLSEEDLQKNKAIIESLTKGNSQEFANEEVKKEKRSCYSACLYLLVNILASCKKSFPKSTARIKHHLGGIYYGSTWSMSAFRKKFSLQRK